MLVLVLYVLLPLMLQAMYLWKRYIINVPTVRMVYQCCNRVRSPGLPTSFGSLFLQMTWVNCNEQNPIDDPVCKSEICCL